MGITTYVSDSVRNALQHAIARFSAAIEMRSSAGLNKRSECRLAWLHYMVGGMVEKAPEVLSKARRTIDVQGQV